MLGEDLQIDVGAGWLGTDFYEGSFGCTVEKVDTVELSFDEATAGGKAIKEILDEKEELYQHLWQQYFKSVNIVARKNTKLHIQHMPKRYWKYLTEKH